MGTGFFDVYVDGTLVNTLGPGSLFGEMALLFAAPRNATIVLKKDNDSFSDSDSESDTGKLDPNNFQTLTKINYRH